MDDTCERWLPAPGYEGRYEVSDQGRVRSLGFYVARGYGSQAWWPPRIHTATRRKTGNRYVQVVLSDGERRKAHLVHTLVLRAFVGEPPPGKPNGLHRDDDTTNNTLPNLYWGSDSDNAHDRVRNGHDPKASATTCLRGHPLTGSNLLRRGHLRQCKACSHTASARWRDEHQPRNGRRRPDPRHFQRRDGETFEQEADRRYRWIVARP